MGKEKTKGRYIEKVGFYDIYAKDTTKKNEKGKEETSSTDYVIYHSKNMVQKGFKTKQLAVSEAKNLFEKHEKTISNKKG